MRAAKVQASLRIRAVSPEPPLLAHTSIESRGTFTQKARSLAPLNGWACAVEICHDGMLEDTNSLDGAHITHASMNLSFPVINHTAKHHFENSTIVLRIQCILYDLCFQSNRVSVVSAIDSVVISCDSCKISLNAS